VQRGPDGTFVYVVGADDKATVRPITVQKQDENRTVVASGLKPQETVVTTGFARLTDGAKVTIGSNDPAPVAAGAQQGNGQRGNGERRQRGGNGSRPAAQQ